MPQAPKFIVTKDEDYEVSWKLEAANGEVKSYGRGTFVTAEAAREDIIATIESTISAAGVSISLGTEFSPIIEFIGFEEDVPGPEEPYAEETTEDQPEGHDQSTDSQEDPEGEEEG